ncbi:MAG: UvrD-helicase domain-containing protein [Burkholderiales bacterium]|nr:UvrD-helicase domain-containing protein [Burkholderiales bacterium]
MSTTAYEVDGQPADPARFYEIACDPARSVVVEACAGAGKTWMLVSRILRAWLDGVPPQQILAITFTRKAAGEMRERLHEWLAGLASASPQERAAELRLRGVPTGRIAELVPRLAQIHTEWLESGRGVEIHTIHGWFSRLVKAAPLDLLAELSLPPELQLVEDVDELWPALWGRFLRRIDAAGGEATQAVFTAVIREAGRFNTEEWLKEALHNRLELTLADQAGVLDEGVASAGQWDARWAAWSQPVEALTQDVVHQRLSGVASQLGRATAATPRKAGDAMAQALAHIDLHQRRTLLTKALFNDQGEPRKKLGEVADLDWAIDWLQDLQRAQLQHEAHLIHSRMATLSRCLFEEYAAHKRERGLADMADLELAAARLLGDEALSGWVQQRLDSQVRQVLMDEFQDTSPLQWQALRAWLAAYAGAGGGASGQRPVQVFLVGDPKQSIYRFRRADPRVFEAAKRFVIEGLGGHLLACDHTRRNAPVVIDMLNTVMGHAHGEGAFPGFRAHTTSSAEAGQVRVLPGVNRQGQAGGTSGAEAEAAASVSASVAESAWRDTLCQPREVIRSTPKALEAAQVGRAIHALIQDEGMAPQDIFVLSRTRATLALVAQSLDAHGVPHVAPDNTPLIDTPEVQDLLALMELLVSPHHDLAMAHALRSPIFGASDRDLMALASRVRRGEGPRQTWWQALMNWSSSQADRESDEGPSPELQRAASLLPRWQAQAALLPPHDLLTRILVEGEVRERMLARVPVGQREQCLFHVDALITHCLDMDSGRDATPYRWIRTLRQSLSELPARAQAGCVQLLTIHGAKGLEAKVVCLVDTDPAPSRRMSHGLLIDWPEGSAHPQRVAFVRSEVKPPPSLADVLEAERQADQREELNALYVALTRARNQLLISRNEPRNANPGSWWQRLVQSGAIDPEATWLPVERLAARAAEPPPPSLQVMPELLPPSQSQPQPQPMRGGVTPPPSDAPDPEADLLRRLGQVVHRALETLTVRAVAERSATRIQQSVQAAGLALGLPRAHWPQVTERVSTILRRPELQPWLDPAQLLWAGNEVALTDGGQVLRIDRLVARQTPQGRTWWVLDYKLGEHPDALQAHQEQMARYVSVVAALQAGEPVKGAFITGSGQWVSWEPPSSAG